MPKDTAVLVVYDDVLVRHLIAEALEQDGHPVASGGYHDALDALGTRTPRVVLLGLHADEDARRFREALRQRHGPAVPLVGLSTSPSQSAAVGVRTDALLSLPFTLDELAGVVGPFSSAN